MERRQEILVFPRADLPPGGRFVPWADAGPVMAAVAAGMAWLPRDTAEQSGDWLQPIPCALIRNEHQEYRVLRRVKQGRHDLSSRISLVVGGHIDRCPDHPDLQTLLSTTLAREVDEELGLSRLPAVKPVGVVVDDSSAAASRHIGFVNEIILAYEFKPRATEEFSTRSKVNGQLYAPAALSRFRKEFDPWSQIIFADYIAPSYAVDLGIQPSFSLARNG